MVFANDIIMSLEIQKDLQKAIGLFIKIGEYKSINKNLLHSYISIARNWIFKMF